MQTPKILKNYSSNLDLKSYSLVQDYKNVKITKEYTLSLHRKGDTEYPLVSKECSDSFITRTKTDGSYISRIPRGGSGNFTILDKGLLPDDMILTGSMQKGKIISINNVDSSNTAWNNNFLSKLERFLKESDNGSIKIQNLTKVYLKKAVDFMHQVK